MFIRIKKLLIVSFVFLISLSFYGCHKRSKGDIKHEIEIPEEFDITKNYNITFWAKNESNIVQKRIYEKAVSDFEAIYPNIKVKLVVYGDYKEIYNDVITNIATNTTPNICISYPDHVATYMTGNNIVVSLDDYIKNEKYGFGGSDVKFDTPTIEELIPKFMDEFKINGTYYGLPYMRSSEACYVNKTYVEKLGFVLPEKLTWDFIWQVSEYAMTQKEENQILIPLIYKSTDNMMIQMLKQKGYDYTTDNGEILMFNEKTESLLEDLASHARTKSFSTFKISSYPGNYFNKEQCIFAIDSTAGATWMGPKHPSQEINMNPNEVHDFEMEVMELPQFDLDNPKMISQGPSICIFNKSDPQEVLASWLFAQYLLSNDVQIAYSQTEGYIPVTYKAQRDPDYLDYLSRCGEIVIDEDGKESNEKYYDIKIKAAKIVLNNIDNTFVTPVFRGSSSVRDAAGEMIESVVKSINRKEEINKEYYNKLFKKMVSLYRLDQLNRVSVVGSNNEKKELGSLPQGSVILLTSLVVIWIAILSSLGYSKFKSKHKSN